MCSHISRSTEISSPQCLKTKSVERRAGQRRLGKLVKGPEWQEAMDTTLWVVGGHGNDVSWGRESQVLTGRAMLAVPWRMDGGEDMQWGEAGL